MKNKIKKPEPDFDESLRELDEMLRNDFDMQEAIKYNQFKREAERLRKRIVASQSYTINGRDYFETGI